MGGSGKAAGMERGLAGRGGVSIKLLTQVKWKLPPVDFHHAKTFVKLTF